MTAIDHAKVIDWLMGGDTGRSSEAIVNMVVRGKNPGPGSIPRDPSDFGRCERMLRTIPGIRERLHQMDDLSPAWAALVRHWGELVVLIEAEVPSAFDSKRARGSAPKSYARMQELRATR